MVIIIIIITLYPFPPHHDVGKVGTHPQYCAKSKLGICIYGTSYIIPTSLSDSDKYTSMSKLLKHIIGSSTYN